MPETESQSDAPAQAPDQPAAEPPDTGDQQQDWQAEAEKWKALARKHETENAKALERIRTNTAALKELEQLKQQSMTEQEKAVAQARAEARTEALRTVGGRLVDAEVRVAATGRPIDVPTLLEGLDRTRFLNDDGEPDTAAITAWVDKLAPPPAEPAKPGFPDLGQGARGTATSSSPSTAMNSLLRGRR